jgi:hypothetical protein
MSSGGLILAGDVRLGFYGSDGAFLGYMQNPINVTELTLTPGEGETRDRVSRMRETYGQALDSVTLPEPWTTTFTTDTISSEILRALFLGLKEEIDVDSGTITDEEITARVGTWVPTSKVMFTDLQSVEVKDDQDTTLSEGTDYLVDLRNGAILALASGAITDGDTIKVSASYGGIEGFRINGARRESLTVAVLLDGRSLRDEDEGKVIRMIARRISIRPAGGNDIMSDEWFSPQFQGTLLTPQGENQPFFYEEYSEKAA